MADISNCCRPLPMYLKWSSVLVEEFFLQPGPRLRERRGGGDDRWGMAARSDPRAGSEGLRVSVMVDPPALPASGGQRAGPGRPRVPVHGQVRPCPRPRTPQMAQLRRRFFVWAARRRTRVLGSSPGPAVDPCAPTAAGINSLPLPRRQQPYMGKSQVAFMNYVVIPMLEAVAEFLPPRPLPLSMIPPPCSLYPAGWFWFVVNTISLWILPVPHGQSTAPGPRAQGAYPRRWGSPWRLR